VNGVAAGIGQLITLAPGQEGNVKFDVTFSSAGTATLMASLYPPDSNSSNDMFTKNVKVKDCNDKDKSKDKDK
jgi:hypothetical protein